MILAFSLWTNRAEVDLLCFIYIVTNQLATPNLTKNALPLSKNATGNFQWKKI